MNTVNQIKSNLARILATENIHIRHEPGAETASFDVKGRVLTLPVWQNISNDLYDMLIVHEVGHALDTPGDGWVDAIKDIVKRLYDKSNVAAEMAVKDFLNVIEDVRIDKRQKRRFPGSKRNYIVGLKELYEKNFFGIVGRDVNQLSFIDRANLYFKGGSTLLNIKFTDEERKFIRRMENTETFDEVIALTEEIFTWARKNGMEEKAQQTVRGLVISEDGDDEDGFEMDTEGLDIIFDMEDDEDFREDEGNDGDQKGLKARSSKSDEDEDGDEGDSEGSSDKEQASSLNSENGAGGKGADDFIPESETEKAARKNMKNFIQSENVEFVNINIPEFNLDRIVDDFNVTLPRFEKQVNKGITRYSYYYKGGDKTVAQSRQEFQDWKNKEKESIAFMVKEFEMRKSATTYSRISISKTGILDPNKLHSYKFNDDVFRRVSSIPKGKNHGFVMFVDWSGSMEGNLKDTIKQLLSLVMFCKKVGIPFEVFYFRSAKDIDFDPSKHDYGDAYHAYQDAFNMSKEQMSENPGDLLFSPFKLCNILSSRMNLTTFNKAMTAFWMAGDFRLTHDALWSTPLNQTILAADKIVNKFRKDNKAEIVSTVFLTDGCSDNPTGYKKEPKKPNQPWKPAPRKRVFVLNDSITKRSFFLENNPAWMGREGTNMFLQILKERTGTNMIGFFLSSANSIAGVAKDLAKEDVNTEANQKFYRENFFIPVTTEGYDEYYVINTRKLSEVYDDTLNVDSKMTKGKMAREFIKYSGRKAINRVLLSSFIKRVASDDKKAA